MNTVPPPGGHVGVHGMIAFGNHYLSHIPMFHEPHDYQILMDVEFKHPEVTDTTNFGQELHTFVPDKFSLGDLLNGKLERIEGTMFKGNFEKDGTPIMEHVEAEIKEVLHSHKLSADSVGSSDLEYVLYGSHQDAYLVHPIEGNAEFDQILKVDCQDMDVTDEQMAQGILVKLPGRPNTVDTRLVPAREDVTAVEPRSGAEITLHVAKELSVLVGPHFMDGPSSGHGHGSH